MGQEMDNEAKGVGNLTTAQYWEYDSRIGKRWNIDPVVNPSVSPYSTVLNNPIFITDSKGACPDGNCGAKEIVAAYEIVKKNFDPKKNWTDISEKLKADATEWVVNQYNSGKYPKNTKASAVSDFESVVMEIWDRTLATSGFKHFESNDKIIQKYVNRSR
ncbi:MAG: hypothetical protein IPP79_04985 [Chitinophagaceae bacterium]|nr:hypothetical protein [Chitinophagaceae bacterium]